MFPYRNVRIKCDLYNLNVVYTYVVYVQLLLKEVLMTVVDEVRGQCILVYESTMNNGMACEWKIHSRGGITPFALYVFVIYLRC